MVRKKQNRFFMHKNKGKIKNVDKKKKKYWLEKVYTQTYTLKEDEAERCERKVQKVHQPQLTLREQNRQRGKDNAWNIWSSIKRTWYVGQKKC